MLRSMLKVAAATAAFGLLHSALASRTAKQAAAGMFGERNRNGLYRVIYIGQSIATFGLLASYIRRQPSRELYCIEGLGSRVFGRASFRDLASDRLWPNGYERQADEISHRLAQELRIVPAFSIHTI